jgi:hypothetical protein
MFDFWSKFSFDGLLEWHIGTNIFVFAYTLLIAPTARGAQKAPANRGADGEAGDFRLARDVGGGLVSNRGLLTLTVVKWNAPYIPKRGPCQKEGIILGALRIEASTELYSPLSPWHRKWGKLGACVLDCTLQGIFWKDNFDVHILFAMQGVGVEVRLDNMG